ncbi:structural maintenance of chromosomes protein 2 [Holotrichia oblita]|uniref:Structural maintenance of chromosomes protein 2 n=1 Tax=Holotrichia oblita TaxID=644536 RepID=A0ACB9SPW1_HOLOL|nr:structural maintenance of chromosomes protein 2 [Holotrichia oblita]
MDCDKWEDVLIQWINCLKLSDPVNDLQSLKNSEFLSKLLSVLNASQTPATCDDCLGASIDLIKSQYPNYIIDKEYLTDLSDLPNKKVMTVCSLLLHYACVIERKDTLIMASCKLPPDIQHYIKNFLEKVNSKITNFHFKKIIEEMNESNISSTSYQWMPIGDSPLVGKSPLQDFLRSPNVRSTSLEKNREIKRLKSELEIERFEKADLQEELKEQKEQIKKLGMYGNQIKTKTVQISKLRSELYTLENEPPPHNKETTTIDIEKKLKAEIQTLEQYVDQLQSKQDDLQEANISISEKLRSSTKELKMWQLTAQSLELNNKELSEKYSKQGIELENLRLQCTELSAILDEIRNSNDGNDSSIYFSPSKAKRRSYYENGMLSEDLAHTIVDVQLKDAQKENIELNDLLRESIERGNDLQKELETTNKRYEDLCKNFTDLEQERNVMFEKVAELTIGNDELKQLKLQNDEKIEQLSESNSDKDSEISALKSELEISSNLCKEYLALNESINSELGQLKVDFTESQRVLSSKNDLYENLRKEADLLQVKYDESVKKYNDTNFNLENVKENYNNFTKNLENSLTKLEKIVCGYNEMQYDDDFLPNLIAKIEFNKNETSKEISRLKQSVMDYEELVTVLRKEIFVLTNEAKINADERENLKKLVAVSEISMKELQETIKDQNIAIKDKIDKIMDMNSTIDELKNMENHLKNVLTDKEVEINNYVAKEMNLKETVNKLEEYQALLKENFANKNDECNELKEKNTVLHQGMRDMELKLSELTSSHTQKLMDQEKMYLEKIHLNHLQIQEFSVRIEELEKDLKLTAENLDLKSAEYMDLQDIKSEMEKKNVQVIEDFQRKINITDDTIKKLEIELTIVKNERENLQNDVNNLNGDREKILAQKEDLSKEIQDLKSQLKSSFEKLSNAEDECSQKDTIISEHSKELLNIKLDLETKKQEYKNLLGNVEKLNAEASSYKFCIETLEAKSSDFESKIMKLEKELEVLNNLRQSLETKNFELTKYVNDILVKINTKDEELSITVKTLNDQKEFYESELKNAQYKCEQANKSIENLENERANIIDKHNNELTILKQEITKLNDKIFELNAKEIDYIHELQVIKSELNVAFEKYTQSFDQQQELKSEYDAQIKNLTENLHEIVAKYNQLKKDQQYDVTELKTTNDELLKLKDEKVALEIKIIDQKRKYDQEIAETTEQFNTDLKHLQTRHAHLEQALVTAKTDLEQQRGIQFRLENDVKKVIVKLSDVEAEKAELLHKIESLENIKIELEDDYKSLNLRHEDYILASEGALKQCENQFQNQINNVQQEKHHIQVEMESLRKRVDDLKIENETYQKEIQDNQEQYQKKLVELQNKIEYYECTNTRIIEEQASLQEKISNYQNQNKINDKITTEQAEMLSKLKSAYDILQTGKDRFESDLKNVQEQLKNVESERITKEIEIKAVLTENQDKLKAVNDELVTQKQLLEARNKELTFLNNKLSDLQRVNEAMRNEVKSLEHQLKRTNENHQIILNKIEEENLQTINEMTIDFDQLKLKYKEITEEIVSLRNERKELKENINNSSKSISEMRKIIESKETTIEEFKIRIKEIEKAKTDKEIIIKELGDELTDTVNKIMSVKHEKFKLNVDLEEARIEIERLKRSRDEILESKHKIIKETEDNILRAHANAIDVKNDLLTMVENAKEEVNTAKNEKLKLQQLLEEEKAGIKFLEIELLNMKNEKSKFEQLYFVMSKCFNNLHEIIKGKSDITDFDKINEEDLQKATLEIETKIVEIYKRSRELEDVVSKLHTYEAESHSKLIELEKQKLQLNQERDELLLSYNSLLEKNQILLKQQTDEKEQMQEEITKLQNKYQENSLKVEDTDAIKTENDILHQTIISLKDKNVKAYNIYNEFAETSKSFKTKIDKILKDRNVLDTSITELRQSLIQIQTKFLQLNREFSARHLEQKESFEFIVEDIQKQFNRYSKIAYNLAYNNVQISEKVVQGILQEKYLNWEPLLKELNVDEVCDKLEELQDRTKDTLEQLTSFLEVLDKNEIKNTKILKENILKTGSSSQLSDLKKDEELRKKYNALRQKLTLTENVKNNFEKKVRQLREENKKLQAGDTKNVFEDTSYKLLLQQHLQSKEEFETKLSELKVKYQKLHAEYVELKKQKVRTEDDGLIERNERENLAIKEAYGKLMSDNSRLERDNTALRKVLEDKNGDLAELSLVREAYEKLLEENSKMMTEVDTLKYKRSRDKEEYLHLYKEELDKETRKLTAEKDNYDLLKFELEESKRTIEQLKTSQKLDMLGSRESLSALSVKSECDIRDAKSVRSRSALDARNVSSRGGSTLRNGMQDRRYATMPRSMAVIDENKRSPISAVPPNLGQNLEMEDEGELFNNKYLADLKEGHCAVGTSGDSRSSRVSELVWRNSMCPPHLKSSYPAELQFASPTRFKEEDIKTGNIDFDDSMSTKLLPGEKSRKKDIGTTSYKKPGPPTPSKNGGRLSLQSNELQPPRDVQDFDSKTPKRSTPSRIKNLFFRGRNSTAKNSTEVGELEKQQSWTLLNSSSSECSQTFLACSCTCHKKIVCVCPIGRQYILENCCMKMIVTNIWCCTKHILALVSMIAATVYINSAGLNQIISL